MLCCNLQHTEVGMYSEECSNQSLNAHFQWAHTGDGKMRGASREVGIVRGERARIRARNGVICEAACKATCNV